jgi:hypothetical protein
MPLRSRHFCKSLFSLTGGQPAENIPDGYPQASDAGLAGALPWLSALKSTWTLSFALCFWGVGKLVETDGLFDGALA